MAAIFLIAVVWPASHPVGTETPDALRAAAPVLWLAPEAERAAKSALAEAVDDLADGRAASALPVLARAAEKNELGGYALLYLGRAQLALDRLSDARATVDRLLAQAPGGYLADAVRWLAADIAEAGDGWPTAVQSLQALASAKPLEPERVYLRLGRDALKTGDTALAISSFTKVYYDYALSSEAAEADVELAKLNVNLVPSTPEEFARQFERAQQFYDAKRYTDARSAFALLRGAASTDDRPRVDLRIGACDYYLKHYTAAKDELLPLVPQAPEAEFFYLSTLRELGRHDEYVDRARAFVEGHPASPLAEEALNNLGTHYVLVGEDEKAARLFAELYSRFPTGAHANRAAWRSGWWKYKNGQYAEAAQVFESAATALPGDNYRPSWLYWAGRSHQRLGERHAAANLFRQVIADYRNSYYGRQAVRAMSQIVPGFGQIELVRRTLPALTPGEPPPTADVIHDLLGAGLYDTAILELRKAQAEFGRSPLLDATMAYALNRKGELYAATVRMRRAYPQFLADGGELLPKEIRRVIFPIAYWDVISRYAAERNLDPYLMAALVNQESAFEAGVKSSAGAWGLMQIMPSTGRQIAARLRIRPFTVAKLKQPEVNVRIGMANFSSMISQYGSIAPALAAYNAGDTRVSRWLAERRDFDQDEFVDDIPFPETQNYVKRILGTAEDYRTLYASQASSDIVQSIPRSSFARTTAASSAPEKKPAVKAAPKSSAKAAVKKAPAKKMSAKKTAAKKTSAKKSSSSSGRGKTR